VLRAWRELQRIRRESVQLQEMQGAQLCALMANINRDPKKGKAFELKDFQLFARDRENDREFSPEVAAVALALRHEDKAPPLLLACWPQVLSSAGEGTRMPTVRALHSDDDALWILAPAWEASGIRGGLVLVRGRISGVVTVRDLDRPLLTYRLRLPSRQGFGWIEAGCLLLSAED
jgi:hypothetical protein